MSSRQFYIVLSIFLISLKIQKMPCLVSSALGKDIWVMAMLYFVIEIGIVMLALYLAKKTKDFKLEGQSNTFKVIAKGVFILASVYFLFQSILFYETIQDLFEHILFDNLPWTVFSLLLVAAVFYLASSGFKNIILNFELYSVIIFVSLFVVAIFGGLQTNFTNVLPLNTINFKMVFKSFFDYNFWFGDFIIVYLLALESHKVKAKWTFVTYLVSALFVVLIYIEFAGIYLSYAPMQANLISVLSEQSMLGVNIGRIDWFLILMSEIGTILCSGLCMFYAKKFASKVFTKVNHNIIIIVLMLILYLLDVLLLVDTHIKEIIFVDNISYISVALKVIFVISCIVIGFKSKNSLAQNSPNQNSNQTKNSLKSSNKKSAGNFAEKPKLKLSLAGKVQDKANKGSKGGDKVWKDFLKNI